MSTIKSKFKFQETGFKGVKQTATGKNAWVWRRSEEQPGKISTKSKARKGTTEMAEK